MRALFLCGPGRTGTTVLRRALSHHPRVATMPGEFRLNVDPGGVLDLEDAFAHAWDPYGADAALHRFQKLVKNLTSHAPGPYRSYALDEWVGPGFLRSRMTRLPERLGMWSTDATWTGGGDRQVYESVRGTRSSELRAFVEDLYRRRNVEATHWVDDTPHTGLHAERLAGVYPDRAFVICVRHPFDVFASFLRGPHAWTPKRTWIAARRIREVMMVTRQQVSTSHRDVILRVEDAVADPGACLSRVMREVYLATPDSEVLDFMVEEYDVDKANVGRWTEELTGQEIDVARTVLNDVCAVYGYGQQ